MVGQGFVARIVKPGDTIRSSDWNAALSEIARLGRVLAELQRRAGIKRGAGAPPRGVRAGAEGVRAGAEGVRR